MTEDFQTEIFRFVLQSKEGRKYFKMLNKDLFSNKAHTFLFDLVYHYYQKYDRLPSKVNLTEYFFDQIKGQDVKKEVIKDFEKEIRSLYIPHQEDIEHIRDKIVDFAKSVSMAKLFEDYAGKLDDPTVYERIQKEVNKISKLGIDEDTEKTRGVSILEDDEFTEEKEVTPTYLEGLNKLTAAGGFYTPQLIILMAAPKGFKTGNLIKLGAEWVKMSKKVYYVDCENGLKPIRNRFKQAFLECTLQELQEPEMKRIYREMRKRIKVLGGDMRNGFYPAYSKSVLDVEIELEFLKDEYGWVPDIILWDYPDLMEPIDKTIKDKRLKIQAVYFDIIKLNNKLNVFSVGLSQVNRAAVGKAVIDMKAFAEDFGKAANAHAAFAICRTPEEEEAGIARIIPVVQREGVQYKGSNQCTVEIHEEKMLIVEIDLDKAGKNIKSQSKAKSRKPLIDD